jgi:hypothetical protein
MYSICAVSGTHAGRLERVVMLLTASIQQRRMERHKP